MTNLLNPKIGAFYVAILPQFIPAHSQHLMIGLTLAGVHDAEGIIWFTMLISAAHLARQLLQSSRVHRIMDRIAGTALIGFGVKLALSNA
jgi:threonine/homoserine/homoserine lactone efflux protein